MTTILRQSRLKVSALYQVFYHAFFHDILVVNTVMLNPNFVLVNNEQNEKENNKDELEHTLREE